MALQSEEQTFVTNSTSSSQIFATVQQLSSQINENRMPQVIDAIDDLTTEDKQLIVDLLSMALEKHHQLLANADRVLHLLTQIASSHHVLARNRTLNSKYLTSDTETVPPTYIIQGEPSSRVRVIKRAKEDISEVFGKILVTWAHLSHPNILQVYGAFLDGKCGPVSLVSPCPSQGNIVDYAKTHLQTERILLISDVIDGVCYLHQLSIVHGAINPQSVLISDSGRALVTHPDVSSETSTVRYSAPEVLEDEDACPTKAVDVWALGCLCYEVLSGNAPFCDYRQDKVALAIVKHKRPIRPGQGVGGEVIDDILWRPTAACWEFEPEDRPSCFKLHDAFASMGIHDNRPRPEIRSAALTEIETPTIDLESTRSLLTRVLGSDQLLPPPSQIPEHLRGPLSGLAGNPGKASTVALAAKKLNPGDTQTLVDALDLVLEENSSFVNYNNPVMKLLTTLMTSTHTYPQRYKLRRLRYDPSFVVKDGFGKVHKGRDLDVYVNVVTNSNDIMNIVQLIGLWAHASHPNILPFYGVFDEFVEEIPRFCLVSPYTKNGTLYDYAPLHPQKSRIPLISDVIRGLNYLHNINIFRNNLRPDIILISDEGRALVSSFNATLVVTGITQTNVTRPSASYMIRFQAPEKVKTGQASREADVWSFGCLCYEVLSRKFPYHQYREKDDVQSALFRGEHPKRPDVTDGEIDLIEDQFWQLIRGCCRFEPGDRLTVPEIKKLLENMRIQDNRPDAQKLPDPAIMSFRKRPDIEWNSVKQILGQIQVELLRNPLAKLVQNHIKDVAAEVVKLELNDVQTLVDFLDVTLKDHLTISDERNRILVLLSRIMTSAHLFPQSHELKGIRYDPKPIAEGGYSKVHRGCSDPTICIKVLTKVNDMSALIFYNKELILWAHSSHPNILPFYGMFFDDSRQICLVSPYMTKGNLREYARQLPQKSRIPLLLDTIKGLDYLHGLGVVHTDLKGENVLISDEGRGLITDFGASHIVTATTKGGPTSSAVAYTLRFTPPEIIRDQPCQVRPTKECDIWSFGCLCYEVLSRKLPYYEYRLDALVVAALYRGQLPRRPRPANDNTDNVDDWDEFEEKDWDDLDDTVWGLITTCLRLKPEDRPIASRIQELIIDMKAWDSRPAAKGVPGAEILKQKSNINVDLNRVRTLLDHLQILFLARSIYKYSDQEVVTAVTQLNSDDATTLTRFWALALKDHLSKSNDLHRLLAIHSAVAASRQRFQAGYILSTRPQYHREIIGEGSFGKVYRGTELNTCVKVTKFSQINPKLITQWHKALVPWAHSSHPNILPFFGVFLKSGGFLVSPFVKNGNLHNYAPGLPRESRMVLVSDVIEGLMYLHGLGIIHSNLKTQNVLISDEGRSLITDFRPYHVNIAAAADGPTGSFITGTLRFTAPELVKNSQMLPTPASDVWSVGCLFYEVLSLKIPYYQYTQDSQIRSALSRGELAIRPNPTDDDADSIDDRSWDLIIDSCALEPERRLKLTDIRNWFRNMGLEDNRSAAKPFPATGILKQRRQYSDVDILHVGDILDKLEAQIPGVAKGGFKDDGLLISPRDDSVDHL